MKKKSTRATHEFIIKVTNIGGQSPEQFDIGGGGDGAARQSQSNALKGGGQSPVYYQLTHRHVDDRQ